MRNENSRFAQLPSVNISRSKFKRDSTVKTSFNVGDLVPFYIDEVLPGDTFQVKTNMVARMQPLVSAPMDNLYLDTYFFFVPNRLVWNHWKELNGENTDSAWIPETEYQVPQITAPTGGWNIGTIADYFGIPVGISGLSVSALPFRAYSLICNEWFRDQNLKDPLETPVDDTTVVGVNTGNYITDCAKGGLPFKAAKLHDYFTSCLPGPQKGPDVSISLAQGVDNVIPVTTYPSSLLSSNERVNSIHYGTVKGFTYQPSPQEKILFPAGVMRATGDDQPGTVNNTGTYVINSSSLGGTFQSTGYGLMPDNLGVQLSSVTINQLRTAFQIQKMYERDARGGTRYTEILRSHFGVTSPDSRLQRPEYLGGQRIPININQVIQSSSSVEDSPQGNVAAYSLTAGSHGDFIQSFTEHGFILGLMVARYEHTYQQGLNRLWSKKSRTDFYLPVLANIGEQPVLNKEIYAQGTAADNEVFGYQEAWADYRYKPSIVTGEMRSNHNKTLDSWHWADDYDSQPMLSSAWIDENKSNIDRSLAVTSSVANQLYADIFVQNDTTRPMPVYSIPGFIDHN